MGNFALGEYLTSRLQSDDPNRAVLYRLETQTAEMLQRVYYFAKKIAKDIIREVEASIVDPVMQEELVAAGTHRAAPQEIQQGHPGPAGGSPEGGAE